MTVQFKFETDAQIQSPGPVWKAKTNTWYQPVCINRKSLTDCKCPREQIEQNGPVYRYLLYLYFIYVLFRNEMKKHTFYLINSWSLT